jgi:hypothetical protein
MRAPRSADCFFDFDYLNNRGHANAARLSNLTSGGRHKTPQRDLCLHSGDIKGAAGWY